MKSITICIPNKHVFTQDKEQTSSTLGLPVTSSCSEKMVQFPRQNQKMRQSFTCSMGKGGGNMGWVKRQR